jgi:hypothetical protein
MAPSVCCLPIKKLRKAIRESVRAGIGFAQERIGIRANAPGGGDRRIDQFEVVLDDHVEFAQGAVDVAINQKEVSRFPGDVGRGGFGLQGVLECGSLSRNVARDLVCAGEVKPIVGIAWIEGNGGAISFR